MWSRENFSSRHLNRVTNNSRSWPFILSFALYTAAPKSECKVDKPELCQTQCISIPNYWAVSGPAWDPLEINGAIKLRALSGHSGGPPCEQSFTGGMTKAYDLYGRIELFYYPWPGRDRIIAVPSSPLTYTPWTAFDQFLWAVLANSLPVRMFLFKSGSYTSLQCFHMTSVMIPSFVGSPVLRL